MLDLLKDTQNSQGARGVSLPIFVAGCSYKLEN